MFTSPPTTSEQSRCSPAAVDITPRSALTAACPNASQVNGAPGRSSAVAFSTFGAEMDQDSVSVLCEGFRDLVGLSQGGDS